MTIHKLTLLVITDGRQECLRRTLAALERHVDASLITKRVIVNDAAGDVEFLHYVDQLGFDVHVRALFDHRRGFDGAVQAGWDAVTHNGHVDYVLHLEDDFVLNRFWDLAAVMDTLDTSPHLAQMALRRQPWSPQEKAAGGFVAMWPDEYHDVFDPDTDRAWLEQRLFFTTNPSIYPRHIADRGWPRQAGSEAEFSRRIFTDPTTACGFWGERSDDPWCTHIGEERVGIGY